MLLICVDSFLRWNIPQFDRSVVRETGYMCVISRKHIPVDSCLVPRKHSQNIFGGCVKQSHRSLFIARHQQPSVFPKCSTIRISFETRQILYDQFRNWIVDLYAN